MENKLRVVTPSRLHFGMVNPFIRELRRYISAGVAISSPNNIVEIEESDELVITGCRSEEIASRVMDFARRHGLHGLVRIEECIPQHVGLGSTTQLTLAVAYGLSLLNGLRVDPVDIAIEVGLGRYSGVGTYVFKHGGFIVDSGRKDTTRFPGLLLRVDFPENWVFIVVTPPGRGLTESREDSVFTSEEKIPLELVWRASHYLLELATAVLDRDFDSFTRALSMLQESVGSMFSRYQGGVFSSYSIDAIRLLREVGLEGVGQSSWGPSVYGVVNGLEEAEAILEKLRSRTKWSIRIARPCNRGAHVEKLAG